MSARPVRRPRVMAFLRSLGYEPDHVARVRVYGDRVEVDSVETLADRQIDTHRHPIEGRPPASRHLTHELRMLASDVAELLALADPSSTPQGVFEGLSAAHENLTAARHAAERVESSQVGPGGE